MDDIEFYEELRQIVRRRADTSNLVDTMAFVSEVTERLEEDPVFGEFIQVEYSGTGRRNKPLKLHGYTELDDSDGSIGLIIGSWTDTDSPETIMTAMINQLTAGLENFITEAIKENLEERITEANPAYDLACLLQNSISKISRIRLHIFSNHILSKRFSQELCGTIAGIPLEKHIWDLRRLKALYQSSREREVVEIHMSDFESEGISYLEAAKSESFTSFLCVIDGNLLANLFDRYGSRLLEGNVRSFLGMKVGVNKGIRSTIQEAPSLFFAYNNGIAATAAEVIISEVEGTRRITSLVDFQIVNGGQTTASILSARKKDRLSLKDVTVQMKLTKVNHKEAHDLIPKIAQFANTQNKVAIADFFANHPFHRKMEEISRRLQVPATAGVRIQSKWFYERSRGQYQNERLYLPKAKKDAFDLEFPRGQLISKTELAKYDSTYKCHPQWVSLGAQKNFSRFASQFSKNKQDISEAEYWSLINQQYGDWYYQQIIAISILWDKAEKKVSAGRGSWYLGDYRPQIVAYSLAFIFHTVRAQGFEIDLGQIWLKQSIDSKLDNFIQEIAIKVQTHLLHPPEGMSNVGEWCKKDACWESIRHIDVYPIEMIDTWLIGKNEFSQIRAEGRKHGRRDTEIMFQTQVLELVKNGYWQSLQKWPLLKDILLPKDHDLVSKVSSIEGFSRIKSEDAWQHLIEIKNSCENEGFIINKDPHTTN
ncbi:AIPR family protein [Pseudomonas sp. RT6P73]